MEEQDTEEDLSGLNGHSSSYPGGTIQNCYSSDITTYSHYYYSGGYHSSTSGRTARETLKTYAPVLSERFAYDIYNQNNGYPVLDWENKRTELRLSKNQAYIKVGETLNLSIKEEEYKQTDFTWKSSNEDIASVNEEGIVTALEDRIHNNICTT